MTEPLPSHTTAAQDPGEPQPAARWEDYIDIFYAPATVFARRASSGFWLPMLTVTVIGAVIFFATLAATAPAWEAELARAVARAARQPAVSEVQAASMQRAAMAFLKISAVAGPPALMFVTGLTLWLIGRLFGARQTLNQAIMVAAFATVPRLLGGLLGGVQALLRDPAALTSRHAIGFGPARFLDPDVMSPVLLTVASRLDIFTLWATVLLAIGLAVTGRIGRLPAALAAGLLWGCATLFELLAVVRH